MSLERVEELLDEIEPRIEELQKLAQPMKNSGGKSVIKLALKIDQLSELSSEINGRADRLITTQTSDHFPEELLNSIED